MIIDGKAIAADIESEIAEKIAALTERKPALAVVLVGDDAASEVYVRRKKQACEAVGMRSIAHHLPASCSEEQLLKLVLTLNADSSCDGILVQLPLPKHIDATKIMHAIDPRKDVDGFHPVNMGKLLIGETDGFIPCTPLGIHVMLQRCGISLDQKHVVIVGRSTIVGKPMAALLMRRGIGNNIAVTVTGRDWPNMKELCLQADVLMTAIGMPKRFTADMIKEGAVIVDIGINRIEAPERRSGYRLVGDVDYDNVKAKASAITPVPGGVGPMTIAMLLQNTLDSYERHSSLGPA